MPDLDLAITKIMKGDTEVLKIMQGDTEVWPKMPYDAKVKWLQSNGGAYIDTGIKTTSNITVDANVTILNMTGNNAVFGGRVALNNQSNTLYVYRQGQGGNNGWGWRFGNEEKSNTTTNASDAPLGDYHIENRAQARIININNNVTLTCAAATFSTDYNMYLFCMNNGGAIPSSSMLGVTQIKDFKIYDGGILVRDFIPVRKGNVGYLYDKVTKQLFGNANSTGAFTYGNDV